MKFAKNYKYLSFIALSVAFASCQNQPEPMYPDSCYWCISQNFQWDLASNKCFKNFTGGATTAQMCAKNIEYDNLNIVQQIVFNNDARFDPLNNQNLGNFTLPLFGNETLRDAMI